MKKFTLAIAAVVIGFVMAACDTTSPKETVMKATDEFFTQAEQELNETVVDAQGFMDFFNVMNLDKSEFLQDVMAPYVDEEGNVKGFTEEEWNELQNYIYDRATAYNRVEGAKCAEFLTPAIERYEKAVDAFWVKYEAGEEIDDETFDAMVAELDEAEDAVFMFADYDNILPELQERYSAAAEKHMAMFSEE